jgi:hypothetical protein
MKLLDTVRLSDNQKRVIAKIIAAPTPKVAAKEISDGATMVKARDILMDLGLITVALDDRAELTDNGRRVAQSENIADESGNLTPDGEKYAFTDEYNADDKDVAQAPAETPPVDSGMPPADGMGMDQPLNMSAIPTGSILQELLRHANLNIRRQ